jgi:alpha-tubulin suppressor-like RCC1 family protein
MHAKADKKFLRPPARKVLGLSLIFCSFLLSATAHAQLVPLNGVAQVVAGEQHTCALTNGGGVKCWGSGEQGQLGDGSSTDRLTPVEVIGLSSGVQAISAGGSHTCALTDGGGVKCWGDNYYGQLGNGSGFNARLTPVDVTGLTSGVQAISVGNRHSCALTSGGGMKCWGRNDDGRLGDGSTTDRFTPVDVTGLTNDVQAISASFFHTCALIDGGGVKCWGRNAEGQLGDGTNTPRLTPANVTDLTSNVQAITAGVYHNCALTSGGGVKCWGFNGSGRLGDGSNLPRLTPVDVTGLTNGVQAVSAGSGHTCALTSAGGVKCWGHNLSGQLGDGSTTERFTPVDVSSLSGGVNAISAGGGFDSFTCALTNGGGVKCWGDNFRGQLGDGSTTQRLTPVEVSGLTSGIHAIDAGSSRTCALSNGGGVKCWGSGSLGDGSNAQRLTPVDVADLSTDVQAIGAGASHTCALTSGGGVKCWGFNSWGGLGDGSTTNRLTPVDVTGLTSGVQAISADGFHNCALSSGGGVKCWGSNSDGQLGDGSTTDGLVPVDVTGLTGGVQAISAGYFHTCALTSGAEVKCWGSNSDGQLGDGGTTNRLTPADVTGLTSGVQAISAGYLHTCALTSGGGVVCWGSNFYGQLGDGSAAPSLTPVNVSGLSSGVQAISAGGIHTCALTSGGAVKCWGGAPVGDWQHHGPRRARGGEWPDQRRAGNQCGLLSHLRPDQRRSQVLGGQPIWPNRRRHFLRHPQSDHGNGRSRPTAHIQPELRRRCVQ